MNDDGRLVLQIITPEREFNPVRAAYVVLPAEEGYLGVLPRHAPLMTSLQSGVLSYRTEGQARSDRSEDREKQFFAVSGGFAEVNDNRVLVLADTAEPAEEIDVGRAQQALQRAEQRLQEGGPDVDAARARGAIERASARLRTVAAKEDGTESG